MQKHLAIIGTVWPEPNSTAAGSRMLQLIALFQKDNYNISFLSSAKKSEFSFPLESQDIDCYSIALNEDSFDTLIQTLQPSIVLFDRFMMEEQYGWRVAEQCPDAMRILDTEDVHFLRKAREIAYKQNRELLFEDYLSDTFKREFAAMHRCDLNLIISEYEMKLLTETFQVNSSILQHLPFLVEPISENFTNEIPPFSQRSHFISIGNFLHEPNWQTVLQLKKCWKSIKKALPEAELHVYGSYATQKAQQLHNEKEGFLIKGRAVDVATVFNSSKVLLAPIPYGAGLKGKLLESMQFGLPNVTTAIGAEGMHGNLNWNGYITQTQEEFVQKAIALYQNEIIWKQAQLNGIAIINQRFTKTLFETDCINKVNHLNQHLKQHRIQNFLGQVFQHQSLQSTKYMSKWIALKNGN